MALLIPLLLWAKRNLGGLHGTDLFEVVLQVCMRILLWDILDENSEFEVRVDLVGTKQVPVKRQGPAVPDVALPVIKVEVFDSLCHTCGITLINLDEADHEW